LIPEKFVPLFLNLLVELKNFIISEPMQLELFQENKGVLNG